MLILNPRDVAFAGGAWADVKLITINRRGTRVVIDWSDEGPHPTFADVPEQRTDITVVMDVQRGDIDGPRPGESGVLVFCTSPTTSSGQRRRVEIAGVITNVEHEVSIKGGAVRTVNLVAVSEDGAEDPISISDAG